MTFRARHQRGFALVAVFWGIAILSLIAAALTAAAMTARQRSHFTADEATFDALAEAGTNYVIFSLLDERVDHHPSLDGRPFEFEYAGYRLVLSVQDEGGKVDLNAADGQTLARLFKAGGMSSEDAAALSDKVLDWRDKSPFKRLNGAKAADYAQAGLPYGPRNGPFERIDELRLVLGMTPELYERISAGITVFSHNPIVNPLTAPAVALGALLPPGGQSPEDFIAARSKSPAAQGATGLAPGHAVSVTVSVAIDKTILTRMVVLFLTDDPQHSYLVQDSSDVGQATVEKPGGRGSSSPSSNPKHASSGVF